MTEPTQSAFTYRVPEWCKGATVKVNGESMACGEPGRFATIRRMFCDEDVIELDFPLETVFEVLPPRHYVIMDFVNKWAGKIEGRGGSQGTVVRRGPLLFAYPVPANKTEDSIDCGPDFKSWNLRPAGAFNYALAAHESKTEFSAQSPESGFCDGTANVAVAVPVKRIEWELEKGRFTPDIPEKIKILNDTIEWLTLVPYGSTTLRLTVFPDVAHAEMPN